MTLYINTTQGDLVEIAIKLGKRVVIEKKFIAKYKQAERLLPAIEKLLRIRKLSLLKIKKIKIINQGGGFTALRIGVVTANALGYALAIPVTGDKGGERVFKDTKNNHQYNNYQYNIITPIYSSEPKISKKI